MEGDVPSVQFRHFVAKAQLAVVWEHCCCFLRWSRKSLGVPWYALRDIPNSVLGCHREITTPSKSVTHKDSFGARIELDNRPRSIYSPNSLLTLRSTLSLSGSYGWSLLGISSIAGKASVKLSTLYRIFSATYIFQPALASCALKAKIPST